MPHSQDSICLKALTWLNSPCIYIQLQNHASANHASHASGHLNTDTGGDLPAEAAAETEPQVPEPVWTSSDEEYCDVGDDAQETDVCSGMVMQCC